ncbi:hypothetical protein Cgig2_033450 [Carnegiea gigantea]|uniref:CAAX prenyl protease 1 homolog n=1 Tax=Carnegiea gigantea TaxID=171969 RepID=A0A9Q1QQS2_9CARY|nr:hypothetical protein Cgig2_033450 [Carnegiea gigantea]
MASFLSQASTAPHLAKYPNQYAIFNLHLHHHHHHHHHQYSPKIYRLKCSAQKQDNLASPTTTSSSSSSSTAQTQKKNEPENVVLKIAWYASELLGIAASLFRSSPSGSIEEGSDLSGDGSGPLDRAVVVETIKQDFQRSYFVTGNLTVGAYEENCEFADPAGSFRGLGRFKRNCTNFGSLIERCNMKLMKWEDFELQDVQSTILIQNQEKYAGFNVLTYLFETYLNVRQYAAHKLTTLPKPLIGVISQEKFEKARAYGLDKSRFQFVRKFVAIVLDSGILYFKVLPWLWKKSGEFKTYGAVNPKNEIWHTLAFLGVVMICDQFDAHKSRNVLTQIIKLPFSLYRTFVIEAHHGFNKQTIWLFFKDKLKGIALAIFIVPPIVAAIIVVVQKGGPYFIIYLWSFAFVVPTTMMFIYPVLVAPLFNKFTPLPNGELRKKIENLAASLKFPLKKLYVVDGSTRSSHSNAYMYGFFSNKRIVLYDTLLQQCKNDEEVVAVLAHELGHWKLNHVLYGFIMMQYAVVPLECLVYFASNLVSRSFEFQADAYGKKLGYAKELRASLIRLQEENLDTMNPDPWYSAYHYTHPPLVERLAALDNPDKEETSTSSVEA